MTMSRDYRSRDASYDADDRFDRPARAGVAGGLPIRTLELALRHPLTSAACALSAVMIGVISGNALVNQPSRHPNPLFSTRAPIEAEAPRLQSAPANGTAPAAAPIALPRPRPVSALDEPQRMQELQTALRDRGFYSGPVDGVLGPATVEAVRAFERRLGVTPTGEPNEMTLAVLKTLPVVDPMATGSLPPAAARSPAAPVRQPATHVAAGPAAAPVPPAQPRRGVAEGVGYPVATDLTVDVETEATVAAGAVRRAAREPLAQGGNERHQKIQRALVAAGYGPLRADGRWDEKSQAAAKRWEVDHGLAQTGKPSENLVYGLMLEPTRVRR